MILFMFATWLVAADPAKNRTTHVDVAYPPGIKQDLIVSDYPTDELNVEDDSLVWNQHFEDIANKAIGPALFRAIGGLDTFTVPTNPQQCLIDYYSTG